VIALDEPVGRLLPELSGRQVLRRIDGPLDDTTPAVRAITVRDLLTFTFGFVAAVEMFFTGTPWPVMEATDALRLGTLGPPDPATQPDPDTWIAGLSTLPLLAQPGERWLYNTGASVLGVLIARAAGLPYPEFLRSRIFEPLGMRDTAFFTTGTGRLATSYRGTPGGLVVCYGWDGGLGTSWLVDTGRDLVVVAATQLMFEGGQTPQAHEDIRPRPTRRSAEPPGAARAGRNPGRGCAQGRRTTARALVSTLVSPDLAVSASTTRLPSSFSSTVPLTSIVAPVSSSGTTTGEENRTPKSTTAAPGPAQSVT